MRPFSKPQSKRALGVQVQDEKLAFVWFDESNEPQVAKLTPNENLPAQLNAVLPQSLRHWQMVAAAPSQYTWSKTVMLPQVLNETECIQQCRFILQKSLPIALEELWFDYQTEKLPQGFRLDITAIRSSLAETFVAGFAPLKLHVLDSEANSLLRAFRYFIKQDVNNQLLLYADSRGALALCETAQQRQILQGRSLQEVFEAYQTQFKAGFKQIYVYCETSEVIAENWLKVSCSQPFIALGNALWQMRGEEN